jgi:hypothetical protein
MIDYGDRLLSIFFGVFLGPPPGAQDNALQYLLEGVKSGTVLTVS